MDMPGCHCAVPIVKPKVGSHKNEKCTSKPYQYQPLHSSTSIRLLKVQPFTRANHVCEEDLFSPLKGSLVTVDLINKPSYTALSYTWGDPMVYYFSEADVMPRESWYCQCYTIEIDGEEVTISTNLYTALVSLRYIKSATRYADSDCIQEDTEYIWVDALCINQSDLPEKSSQVQMMDQIYLQSKHVLVWLGGADHMSATSILLLNKLTEIGWATRNEKGEYVGLELLPEMELNDPRFYEILGMERHISPGEWSHIFAFLNRSWFRRAWVIQELGLAKKATVVCGLHVFNAAALHKWILFLEKMHILPKIKALGPSIVAGSELRSENSYWHHSGEDRPDTYTLYNSQEVSEWNTRMFLSLEYVRQKRNGINKEFTSVKAFEKKSLPPLSVSLMLFRSTQASDPRDNIYAFLGVSHGGTLPIPPSLVPDYSLSPAQVYIQWAKFLIPSDAHLFLLSLVEDPSLRKMDDLPSWVPDFSTDCRPLPFRMPAPLPFCADRGLGPMFANFPEPGVLEVRGYMLNKISAVARADDLENGGIKAIADFLSPLPAMMGIKNPNTAFHPGTTEVEITDYVPQSRLDMYWRTLITDRFRDEHPAPETCGQAMRISFRRALSNTAAQFHKDLATGDEFIRQWESRWKNILEENAAWESLLLPDEMTPLVGINKRIKFKAPTNIFQHEQMARSQSGKGDNIVFLTGGEFPNMPEEWLDLGDNLPWDQRLEAEYMLEKRKCQNMRKLVIIHPGGLGLAPDSVQIGDEVWILAGSQVPFILRSVDGSPRRYKLIGEAYVHGIMHGEAMEGVDLNQLDGRQLLLV